MKTQIRIPVRKTLLTILVVLLIVVALAFKSGEETKQVMTMVPIAHPMKGDQKLYLFVDGNTVETIELPSAHSSKMEDGIRKMSIINQTLNRLNKEGWKLVACDNPIYTLVK